MSLAMACWWTLARTIVLCLLAWPVAAGIERWIRSLSDARRPVAFAVLLAPCLFPELLVGYVFRDFALASPRRAEWLCAGLLLVRVAPVGVVALLASPASLIGAAAIHCRWLVLRTNRWSLEEWRQLAACYWHGPVRRALPAMALMGLVSFQEFELAALLQTASWTDWFIAAQRFGLDRNEMLQRAVWPVVLQLPLLMAALFWLIPKSASQPDDHNDMPNSVSYRINYAVMIYLGLALICGCLIPLGMVGWNLPSGLKLLIRQPTQWMGLGREILIASAVSVCAGLTAWFAGSAWTGSSRSGRLSTVVRQGLLVPGLIGSLLLSLVTVALFQRPWLRALYDTPLPWVLALIVWLLPRAVLLRLWLNAMTRTEGVYLAEMVESRALPTGRKPESDARGNSGVSAVGSASAVLRSQLLFRLRDQPRLLGMGLLCYWAYLDLSTAYLLAPSGMASGLVRLYNFMHFGRSASLSAESLLFFGTPIVATYVVAQLFRWNRRR